MTKLQQKLNLYGLTMIAVGSCIGSGIFRSPGEVAQAVPHHGLVLIVYPVPKMGAGGGGSGDTGIGLAGLLLF